MLVAVSTLRGVKIVMNKIDHFCKHLRKRKSKTQNKAHTEPKLLSAGVTMRKAQTMLVMLSLLALCGCSVAMSAKRSTYKGDPAIIQVGADRAVIESTFGSPDMTAAMGNGDTKVIYKIDPDAHRAVTRNAAVAGHVVADVLTLGLWEAVGTPMELAAQDRMTTYIVIYGPEGKAKSVETVK
jgi:hypothetical protein